MLTSIDTTMSTYPEQLLSLECGLGHGKLRFARTFKNRKQEEEQECAKEPVLASEANETVKNPL